MSGICDWNTLSIYQFRVSEITNMPLTKIRAMYDIGIGCYIKFVISSVFGRQQSSCCRFSCDLQTLSYQKVILDSRLASLRGFGLRSLVCSLRFILKEKNKEHTPLVSISRCVGRTVSEARVNVIIPSTIN